MGLGITRNWQIKLHVCVAIDFDYCFKFFSLFLSVDDFLLWSFVCHDTIATFF